MAVPEQTGPGLLFVNSKIRRTDILDEETFTKWYSSEHIPDMLKTSGVSSVLRLKNKDPKAEKPYLVLYPMQNIGFTQSEELKNVRIHSDLLPGGGPFDEYIDMDVRVYSFVDKYEPNGRTEPGELKLQLDEQDIERYRANEVGCSWGFRSWRQNH
jgi:hypothetical protein